MAELAVAPLPEVERSPEAIVRKLVDRIDKGLAELGVPPRDARTWGWCNFVPDAVNYCAHQDAGEKGYQVSAAIYQVQDLHMIAAGGQTLQQAVPDIHSWWSELHATDETDIRERIEAYQQDPVVSYVTNKTATHGFNIVRINGQLFLVDLSFSQFFGSDDTPEQAAYSKEPDILRDSPLAQQLLHDGFIELTDETLRAYMGFLCADDPDYLSQVRVSILDRVPALPFDMDDNELDGRIPPSYMAAADSQ